MFENNGINTYMPVAPVPGYGYGNGGGLGAFGGEGGLWLIVLLLFCGWGGNGNGFGGNGNGLYPWLNQSNQINDGFRDQMINGNITGIQSAVTSGFGDVQTALCGGFAGVNATVNGAQNAISQQLYTGEIAGLNRSFAEQTANAQGFNQLQGQLAQCCCDQRLATCQTQNLVQSEAALTRANCDANAQKMMDKLCQLELDGIRRDYENRITTIQNALDAERSANQALRFAASQGAQTATIQAGQRALANEVEQYVLPTPRPAYVVANPNCCPQNTCPQNQCCA